MPDAAIKIKRLVVASPRRSDEVLRRIVAMIFEGHLAPGTRLPAERELAGVLGVSRTTLRDAMNRLEARGYVERRPKSGAFVCTAIPQSLRDPIDEVLEDKTARLGDVIEIRKVLECWAAEKAAQAPTPGLLQKLRSCLKSMKADIDLGSQAQFERYGRADAAFHAALAQMTKNPIYVHLSDFLSRLVAPSLAISRELVPGDFGQINYSAHRQIYQAIQTGRRQAAGAAMLQHFAFVEQRLDGARKPRLHTRSAPPREAVGGKDF